MVESETKTQDASKNWKVLRWTLRRGRGSAFVLPVSFVCFARGHQITYFGDFWGIKQCKYRPGKFEGILLLQRCIVWAGNIMTPVCPDVANDP